jgi:uncharacterized protein YdcH (DUF465 family)
MTGIRKKSHSKTERRNVLLEVILSRPVKMKDCTYCSNKRKRHFSECQMSEEDSSRCTECVRDNKSLCDARPLSAAQLRKIASLHARFEDELEAAEDRRKAIDAEIERLRKQKRSWLDKMTRAVARGIDNEEELDKVEREEAEATARQAAAPEPSPVVGPSFDIAGVDWLAYIQDPSLLFPSQGTGEIPAEPSEHSS